MSLLLLGHHRGASVLLLVLCCLAGPGARAFAQAAASAPANADALPVSDEIKKENPFLRFEIVSLGSYPISLFYVGFVSDIVRYYSHGQDSAYAPWPFSSSSAATLDNSERVARLEIALGVSLTVGLVDGLIHAAKVRKAQRLREARIWAASPEGGP